jgi:SAM-dependent methyltransferase
MRLSEAIDLLGHLQLYTANPAASPSAASPPHKADAPGSHMPAGPSAPAPQRWADLGCGSGLFTEALARFLPSGSSIYGVDFRPTLYSTSVNGVSLIPVSSDFVNIPLPIDDLDGILMANSFHYVKDKPALLQQLKTHLRPGGIAAAPATAAASEPAAHSIPATTAAAGSLLIVEYDTDSPVPTWVPWPVSYASLQPLLAAAGWPHIEKLGERPSAYGRSTMYAALARRA